MRSKCLDESAVIDLLELSVDDGTTHAPGVDVLGGIFGLSSVWLWCIRHLVHFQLLNKCSLTEKAKEEGESFIN